MINLVLADDHKLIRDGLKAMLADAKQDIHIAGEASSGKELIEKLSYIDADVVLMDIQMPEMNGLEAMLYIQEHFPDIKVLILSMMEQEKYIAETIRIGAPGYILKTIDREELIHAIQTVARGERYISTQIAMKLLKNVPKASDTGVHSTIASSTTGTNAEQATHLSAREVEVLRLIARGYTNSEIAGLLISSKRTVETHRQNLLQKTGSKNTACLIRYAAKHQLLEESGSYRM